LIYQIFVLEKKGGLKMKHAVRHLALAFTFIFATVLVVSAGELEDKLLDAAMNGYTDNVRSLIAQGANVNARRPGGSTALISAASNGRMEIVKILIEKGADVNAYDQYGRTALLRAANSVGHIEIIKLLIDNGANMESKDEYGRTALMQAVSSARNANAVRTLIEKGANVNAKNKMGDTALSMSEGIIPENANETARRKEISQILRKAGAR
jgi:hypothetical protein